MENTEKEKDNKKAIDNIDGIEIDKDVIKPNEFINRSNEIKGEIKDELNKFKKTETTVLVNADEIVNSETDKPVEIKVKTGGINSLTKFIKKETKQHTLAEDKEEDEDKKNDEGIINQYISEDEYILIATILIVIIDTVVINVLKFWSGDTRENSFGLTKAKQNQLSGLLAQILKKHNVKWSIELLFVLMLVLGYTQSARNAYEFKNSNSVNDIVKAKKITVVDDEGNEKEVSEEQVKKETRGSKPIRKRYSRRNSAKDNSETEQELSYENVEEIK